MAAEDYIDFSHLHSDDVAFVAGGDQVFNSSAAKRAALKASYRPKKSGKNKDIEWMTGDGEIIRVADMEDSHLGNTIRYICRKIEGHDKACARMAAHGWPVPAYVINRRPGTEWLDILGKEAARRQTKEIAKAEQVLGQA